MRNTPSTSWWPRLRHSRAVCTRMSRPISRSNCSSWVASRYRRTASEMSALTWNAAVPAADRPPGEPRALQPGLRGPLARQRQRQVPPGERVRRGAREGVGQHGQDERLGVPERVAVVAGPRQALGRDHAALCARARLQDVEQAEPDGLLDLGVALDLDVRALPELVQELLLLAEQAVPAGAPRARQRPDHLVVQRRPRALARPPVRDVLDDPQLLAGLQP